MKTILLFLLITGPAAADSADRILYYAGTETITFTNGDAPEVEQLALQKIYSPSRNLLIEIACVKNPNRPATNFPTYMQVNGATIPRISSNEAFAESQLSGTGRLEGESWDWNYLKFSMNWHSPRGNSRIEDENWVSGPHLVAIKELYWKANGDVPEVQTGIITAKLVEISADSYAEKAKALGCPAVK